MRISGMLSSILGLVATATAFPAPLAPYNAAAGDNVPSPAKPTAHFHGKRSSTADPASTTNGPPVNILQRRAANSTGTLSVDLGAVVSAVEEGLAARQCNYNKWNPTVSNWIDADVDAELSSFAFNLVTDAPTGTLLGTWPTKLPAIGTGPGDRSDAVGLPGKLMAAANGGESADCTIVDGTNGQCGKPPSVQDSCGNMPRWAYLAWQAIYNMVSIHIQIVVILNSDTAYELGQLGTLIRAFSVPPNTSVAGKIFLSVLGSLGTLIGILIPLAGIGAATVADISTADIAEAAAKGEGELGLVPKSPGQTSPTPKSENGDDDTGAPEDPDAIQPVSQGQAPPLPQPGDTGNGDGGGDNSQHPVTSKPKGSIFSDPGYLGTVAGLIPGTVVSLSNSIWGLVSPVTNPTLELDLQSKATADYFKGFHDLIKQYNDDLTSSWQNATIIQSLLTVLAGGTFINASWSSDIFETVTSADVISREINSIWRGANYNVYVGYTYLDDDADGTKCNADKNGALYTQWCADAGVYYLNSLNFPSLTPALRAPNGFKSLTNYGVFPWWPTSGSAKAYRALNADSTATPVYDGDGAEPAYSNYISTFAANNTANLLDLMGQAPGTWSLPVCDQGSNFWTYDWDNSGGAKSYLTPMPCACGIHGSGTAAFYTAMGLDSAGLDFVAATCESNLINIDPALSTDTIDNMGWNAIVGGQDSNFKPRTIAYGAAASHTITAPTKLPTNLCHIGASCTNTPSDEKYKPCVGHGCT